MREVQGLIFFGEQRLNPRTKPWASLVRSIVLPDELRALAERSPNHPLVAAFQPLLAESETELERDAGGFFQSIKKSKLKREVKQALEEVFLSWRIQRLPTRTRQEIEKMLIGELPELEETRAGQDLIEIGVERGLAESVWIILEAKRGRLSKSLRQRIGKLQHGQLRQLLAEAATWESVEPLDAWLSEHGQ